MTAEEDNKRIERFRQIDEMYGTHAVLDTKNMKRVYLPQAYLDQQEEVKRFRGEVPKDE